MGPLLLAGVPLVYSIRIDQAESKVSSVFQWSPRAFTMTNDQRSLKRKGGNTEGYTICFPLLLFLLMLLPGALTL